MNRQGRLSHAHQIPSRPLSHKPSSTDILREGNLAAADLMPLSEFPVERLAASLRLIDLYAVGSEILVTNSIFVDLSTNFIGHRVLGC